MRNLITYLLIVWLVPTTTFFPSPAAAQSGLLQLNEDSGIIPSPISGFKQYTELLKTYREFASRKHEDGRFINCYDYHHTLCELMLFQEWGAAPNIWAAIFQPVNTGAYPLDNNKILTVSFNPFLNIIFRLFWEKEGNRYVIYNSDAYSISAIFNNVNDGHIGITYSGSGDFAQNLRKFTQDTYKVFSLNYKKFLFENISNDTYEKSLGSRLIKSTI